MVVHTLTIVRDQDNEVFVSVSDLTSWLTSYAMNVQCYESETAGEELAMTGAKAALLAVMDGVDTAVRTAQVRQSGADNAEASLPNDEGGNHA